MVITHTRNYSQTTNLGQKPLNTKLSSTNNLESEIRKLLSDYNINIQTESGKEATIYCPFHKNTHSPAFYINLKTGLWQCFNPSCDKRGNFRQLYKHISGKSYARETMVDPVDLQHKLERSLNPIKMEELTTESIEIDYDSDEINLLSTLIERGFTKDTLRYLEIGYSKVKDRVVIPVRNIRYEVVGLIGRAIHDWQDPRYLYNKGFKRADVLFNIQNAKRFDECIVVEGSLDCAKVVQAGFVNCVATLGAKVSENQASMLRKWFDKIVIFSDRDDAGDAMRDAIIRSCEGKELSYMTIPSHVKDPGEMSEQEIQQSYINKISIIGGR
jgi:DNA primase